MREILEGGSYNLTFVNNFATYLKYNGDRKFEWLKDYYITSDGLHWDKRTTKEYMESAFDLAGM